MDISYELSERDVRAFNHYRLLSSPDARRRIGRRSLVLAAAFAVVGVALAYLSGQPSLLFVFGAMSVVALLFYARLWQFRIDQAIHAHYREPQGDAPSTRTLRTTDEGLEQHTPQSDVRVRWDEVSGIDELDRHTFISVRGQGAVFIIPDDALPPDERSAFLAECRMQVETARAARAPQEPAS